MELNITSKNIELTPEIKQYIQSKLGRFNRHLRNVMETKIDIVEEKTKSQQHRFLVRVTATGSNTRLHGEERGRTMLIAIDNVARNMQRQIEHHKGKLHDKKSRNNLTIKSGVSRGAQLSQDQKYVIKQLDVKPMSAAEATDQLELLNYNFFFFSNTDTDKLTLLYRRTDGNYGLIEP